MTGAEVSTFASATGGRAAWLARNPYSLPNYTNIDFRVGRSFHFAERFGLSFYVDAFNLFNSRIVSAVNTTAFTFEGPGVAATGTTACPATGATGYKGCFLPSSTFGAPTVTSGSVYGARQLQFNARFEF